MKILKYISIFVMFFGASSCKDYLDRSPDSQLTMEMVFSDKTRTEQWLASAYGAIPDATYDFLRQLGYDAMSDDIAPSPGWAQVNWQMIAKSTGNWTPTSGTSIDLWSDIPKRIRTAYIFIDNVRALPAQGVSEETVINMKNEARFLIAYYHWLLMEVWGPIPVNHTIMASNATPSELMIGQSPYDKTVQWVDSALYDLSRKLPATYADVNQYGRATSVMCLAVRARMLLFAASPLVNGNPDYKGVVNKKGEELFNSTYDPNKWVKARDANKLVIHVADSLGYVLYQELNADGSIDPFMSYQNMLFKKASANNSEILFARPDCDGVNYDKQVYPRGVNGYGGISVTQSLVDAFYMKNGLPITDPASGYSEKGFSAAPERRMTKWIECQGDTAKGATRQVTLKGTFNMYCNREPRFYVSVLYNRAWIRIGKRTTQFMNNEADGGPSFDSPPTGYALRKKAAVDYDPKANNTVYRPGILYRLGESYLNYAEALNETTPGDPDILKYVNLIRHRAGVPDLAAGLNQDDMRAAIRRERRVELNCEDAIRYDDIRRWKIGEQTLDGPVYGMKFTGTVVSDDATNANAYFVRSPSAVIRVFSKKMYWWPVPQAEIDKNPNLMQNPGW